MRYFIVLVTLVGLAGCPDEPRATAEIHCFNQRTQQVGIMNLKTGEFTPGKSTVMLPGFVSTNCPVVNPTP